MVIYRCRHCGNIATKLHDSGVKMVCCGENMQELIPNTTDAATEKHVPVLSLKDDKLAVRVGSIAHPMTLDHHIQFIAVDNEGAEYIKFLEPTDPQAEAVFSVDPKKAITVYEYCNLHGLWAAKL
jgi:superoxide reductase